MAEEKSSSIKSTPHAPAHGGSASSSSSGIEHMTISIAAKDAPIQAVTVFSKGTAEVTRVVTVASLDRTGLYQVELRGLPSRRILESKSVRVTGTGHCTILDVSCAAVWPSTLGESGKEDKEKETAEEKQAEKAIRDLEEQHYVLSQTYDRNKAMRQMVDDYASSAVCGTFGYGEKKPVPPGLDEVEKTLEWWSQKAENTDREALRLELSGKSVMEAIAEVRTKKAKDEEAKTSDGIISVSLDVTDIGPIELKVFYVVQRATWKPAYHLCVDTETDKISCTYYGIVEQYTAEDWEGVRLSLSTATPTVREKPPSLGAKTVSFLDPDFQSTTQTHTVKRSAFVRAYRARDKAGAASPPPPPPAAQAALAVAQVDGGGGGTEAVSFVIGQPVVVKGHGQSKKLTVGIFDLSARVTHFAVPSKEPAAYLVAQATNDTEYMLLASTDVFISVNDCFVARKTSLDPVCPGETFQMCLGIDPAIKVQCAAPRETNSYLGDFVARLHHAAHAYSTLIVNKKKVPVTCVVVDSIPRSTDDVIKVTLEQPPPASVLLATAAMSSESLVSAALEKFETGGGRRRGQRGTKRKIDGESGDEDEGSPSPPSGSVPTSAVTGIMKNESEQMAWVVELAPQSELTIPLEYNVEWPIDKEIRVQATRISSGSRTR